MRTAFVLAVLMFLATAANAFSFEDIIDTLQAATEAVGSAIVSGVTAIVDVASIDHPVSWPHGVVYDSERECFLREGTTQCNNFVNYELPVTYLNSTGDARPYILFNSVNDVAYLKIEPAYLPDSDAELAVNIEGQVDFVHVPSGLEEAMEIQYATDPGSCLTADFSNAERNFTIRYKPLCQFCSDNRVYMIFNYSIPSLQFRAEMIVPFRIPCRATILLVGRSSYVDRDVYFEPRASDWGSVSYDEALAKYAAEMKGRGKTVRLAETDTIGAADSFGYSEHAELNPFGASDPASFSAETASESRRLVPLIRHIIGRVNPQYTILLGGPTIIPMPFKDDPNFFFTPRDGIARFRPVYDQPPIEMQVGNKVYSDDLYTLEQDDSIPYKVVSRLPTPVEENYGPQSPALIIQGLANMATSARVNRDKTLGIVDLCGTSDPCESCAIGDFSDRVFAKFWPSGTQPPYNPSCPVCEPCSATEEGCTTNPSTCRLCECSSDYYTLPGCYPAPESCESGYIQQGLQVTDSSSLCGRQSYSQGGVLILPGQVSEGARTTMGEASTIFLSAHGAPYGFLVAENRPISKGGQPTHDARQSDECAEFREARAENRQPNNVYRYYLITSAEDYVSESLSLSNHPLIIASSCYSGAVDVPKENMSLPMAMIGAGARAVVGNTRKRTYSSVSYTDYEADTIGVITNMYRQGKTLGNAFLQAKNDSYSRLEANFRNQMLLDASRGAVTELLTPASAFTDAFEAFYNAEGLTLYGDPLAYVPS